VTKREYAQQLSAALSHLMLNQGDSVGLGIFDDKIQEYIPPRNRMDQWGYFLEALVSTRQTEAETSIPAVLDDVTQYLHKRGVVILISDLIDDPEQVVKSLAMLRTTHQEVIVFHVLTPEEVRLPYSGTVEFKPLEGEADPLLTTPKRLRKNYQEKIDQFLETYRKRCLHQKIDYSLIQTNQPLEKVLREYLQRRLRGAKRV
jgi:uncharacterized protein (DUF58 family)